MNQIGKNMTLQKKIYQKIKYNVLQRHIYGITSPLRVTPDFLVIGSKRCGTTSLYEYLGEHPCIKKSSHDHIGFFDDNFHLGINFYKSFFPTIFEKIIFQIKNGMYLNYDVTSTYIHNTTTSKRVFETLPKIKIIAIIRNPIDRAYSEYNVNKEINPKIEPFEIFVEKEIEEISNKEESENNRFLSNKNKYLERGLWFEQLEPWFKLFPKQNILILSTEDFGKDSNHIFNIIFKFLNLKKFLIENPKKLRKANYPKLDQKTREKLIDFYKSYNLKFYNLVGKDFQWEK
jgi:hypothetical protein